MTTGFNELPFKDLSAESLREEFTKVTECSICLEDISFLTRKTKKIIKQLQDFDETAEIVSTTCNHIFHRKCLALWVKNQKKNTCPSCRAETLPQIPKEDLSKLTERQRINIILRGVIEDNPDLFYSSSSQSRSSSAPRAAPVSTEGPEEEAQTSNTTTYRPVGLRERAEEGWRSFRNRARPKFSNPFNSGRNNYDNL